jgi:hypothetical protein
MLLHVSTIIDRFWPSFRSASSGGSNRRRFGINEFGALTAAGRGWATIHAAISYFFRNLFCCCFLVISRRLARKSVAMDDDFLVSSAEEAGRKWNGNSREADLMRNVLLEAGTHHVFHVVQHVDKGLDQTTR